MFSGGALSRASIFALGIMPYISASIIVQLLTVVYQPLEIPGIGIKEPIRNTISAPITNKSLRFSSPIPPLAL
jgi:hypothetical protein